MAEQNLQAKLKNLLKQEKVQLWNPPFTQEDDQPSAVHLQELAQHYAPLLGLSAEEVGGALESIRAQAVARGKGNRTFRETSVATLELLLPREAKKVRRAFSPGGRSQSGAGGRSQVGGVRVELVGGV
ncbi:NEDD8 ultimate buster 1-like, partial [Poecilia latipinna]|uniref:NEDD8 ultimate buster 1-like n=1 Tax=Poecilia latipinna TaxID=48699 RepID=UPI00072E5222